MPSSDRKLREFLLAQSPRWLTDRLLGAVASDPALLVALQVAASGSDGVQVVRRELDRALWVDEYVEEDDAPTYAEVLGPTGLARLRGLIGEELQRIPRVAAGERPEWRHSAVLQLAERTARADGVDAVVDVIARDLSSADRFERICRELESAGRVEEALVWARRGIAEVDPYVGQRQIRQTAAVLAGRLGRHGEAAEWVWQDFAKAPSLAGYQLLRQHGEADGSWSGWRDRALRELRALPCLAQPRLAKPVPLGRLREGVVAYQTGVTRRRGDEWSERRCSGGW